MIKSNMFVSNNGSVNPSHLLVLANLDLIEMVVVGDKVWS